MAPRLARFPAPTTCASLVFDLSTLWQNPSEAMYGAQDPASKLFGDKPAKDLFKGISDGAEAIFGA